MIHLKPGCSQVWIKDVRTYWTGSRLPFPNWAAIGQQMKALPEPL